MLAGIADAGDHVGEMGVDIVIGKAEDEQAAPDQDVITVMVVFRLTQVERAIQFNSDPVAWQ